MHRKTIFLLFFILKISFSQHVYAQSQSKFNRYNGPAGESSTNIIILDDKSTIVATRLGANGWGLLHISEHKFIIKSKSFSNTRLLNKIIKTNDGNLILVGSIGSNSNTEIGIMKVDMNFNIIWSKKISGAPLCYAYSALQCANSDLLITGYSSVSGSSAGDWDSFVCRLTSDGNLIWKKTIVNSSNASDWLLEAIELNDGNFILSGATHGGSSVDFLLTKISASGNIILNKRFGGSQNEVIYNITKSSFNGHYIISAGSWSFGLGEYDLVLAELDTNLNFIWSKVYGGNKFDFPIATLVDGNRIITAGYSKSYNSTNNYDLVAYEFNHVTGDLLNTIVLGGNGEELYGSLGNVIAKKANNKYLLTGDTKSYSIDSDIFISEFSFIPDNCCEFVNLGSTTIINQTLSLSNFSAGAENTTINNISNFTSNISNYLLGNDSLCFVSNNINNNIVANNISLCVNDFLSFNTTLTDISYNYLWNFGDPSSGSNNSATGTNVSHQFNQSGTYLITCITSNSCASDTDSIYINVIQEPLLVTNILNTNASYCMGDSIQFKFSTNDTLTNFVWRFDNSTFSNLDSPTHVYTSAGLYNVQLITSNKCYSDTDYVAITIKNSTALNSRITSGNNVQICLGSSFNFIANSDDVNARYHWDFGVNLLNSDTSILRTPSYNYPIAGNYRVRLIVQNDCGIDTLYVDVEVIQSVPFNNNIILNNTTFCKNSSYVFDASYLSNQHVYEWDFGDPASGLNNYSNAMSASHTFSNAGSYLIKCIVSDACRTDTDTIRINVIESIELNTQILNQNMVFCQKETVSFQANSDDPNANYFWNFGDPNSTENTSNTQNASHQFSQTGTYTVRLISTNICLNDTSSVVINIRENPLPDFEFNIDTCASILNLINTSVDISQNNYEWIINDEIISQSNINYILENNNDYEIKLLVNKNTECSDSLVSTINYVVDDSNELLTIPDAFSPNGDNQNDVFIIRASSKCKLEELKIYDRWGNIIYKQNDEDKFYWDGKINNTTQADGVYIVHLMYNGKQYIRTLSLIK